MISISQPQSSRHSAAVPNSSAATPARSLLNSYVAARRDSLESRREHPPVMRRPSSPVPVTPQPAPTTPTHASQLEPVVPTASLPNTSTRERPGQGGHSETPIDLDRLLRDSAAPSVSTSSGAGHARSAAGAPLSRRRLSADGRLAVVGESHYQPALHRAARGVAAGSDFDQHLPIVAVLIRSPRTLTTPTR